MAKKARSKAIKANPASRPMIDPPRKWPSYPDPDETLRALRPLIEEKKVKAAERARAMAEKNTARP